MDILETAVALKRAGEAFVMATVVRAERPTSAKIGAKAIATAGGRLIGWVGGSCAQPTVLREARRVLAEGRPRLIRLSPPERLGQDRQEGVTEVALTCVSGGTLEIYLEPHQPKPQLIAVGHFPIVEALVVLAKGLGYRVSVLSLESRPDQFPDADEVRDDLRFDALQVGAEAYVVVASHGNYDEEALQGALRHTKCDYIALVTSPKRAAAVRDELAREGFDDEALARLKTPAGLDIGAVAPEEIALSILAEIVSRRRSASRRAADVEELATAVDPVCGMSVDVAGARYSLERAGETVYFCSSGCRRSYESERSGKPVGSNRPGH